MFPSRKELATSNAWYARAARALRNAVRDFTLPAPRLIVRPALLAFLVIRSAWHFVRRVFFAEPLFKAYCTRYGRRVRTDIYLPWVQGSGDLIVGDDVLIDGAIGISCAARFVERPTFEIGSHSGIGHGCKFVVAKRITIGNHCRLAQGITMRDSSGHPSDPEARRAGLPPSGDDIKPITVCDDSWIGAGRRRLSTALRSA